MILLIPAGARAEPSGEDEPTVIARGPTAAEVDGKPRPGAESGRIDTPSQDSVLRELGRGVLFVPRLGVEVAFAPVRGGLWAYERYHLDERAYDLFFNKDRTFGIYPIARLESGYGINAGARLEHRDLFGRRETLRLDAAAGGRYQQIVAARVRSGARFARVSLETQGELERRPEDAYYGVGNGDVDVRSGVPVVESRFRERLVHVDASADVRAVSHLYVRPAVAFSDFAFEDSTRGLPILDVYPMDSLVGWDGVRDVTGELEVRWDSRRPVSYWEPESVRSTGWLLAAFGGRVFAQDAADYWRYGTDLQRFVRIGNGPRVIKARLYGEAVSGSLDEVPFVELPRLGGRSLLRGYSRDRFRDRVAALGTLEYAWDLAPMLSASTFVDAGRVYAGLSDLELADLRVGYGVGLEAHTRRTFLIRASVSSSIDGGVFFDVAFDPVFDHERRVERR